MALAVSRIFVQRKLALRLFWAGLLCKVIQATCLAAWRYPPEAAIVVAAVFAIFVVATYSNGIEYYRNDGAGDSFTQQADVDGCSGCSVAYVTSLAVADLDGDAYLDVVVGQGPGVGTSVHFFENEGVSRTFTKRGDMSPSGVSFYPAAISVGDVDKDDEVCDEVGGVVIGEPIEP